MEKKYLVVVRKDNNINTQEVVSSFDTLDEAKAKVEEMEKSRKMLASMGEPFASHFGNLSSHIIEQGV